MSNQEYVEDEINLRDYIKVILKRKKIILTVFFVAVITTAIASFLMPKVYEVTSTIQIGRIDELLMEKEKVKEILSGQNLLEPIIKELDLDIEPDKSSRNIKIEDIKNTNLLKIKVQYPDPEMVVKINKAIADSFVSRGQGIYQERLSLINERLKELEIEIKDTEEDIKRTQSLIIKVAGLTTIPQQEVTLRTILLQNTLSNYKNHLSTLKDRRNELKIALFKAEDFKIVEQPIEPKYPIKPKKKLNILISGIFSLMMGIFLAFFMEYWQSPKKET